jgi:hypothetical protein
MRITAGKQVQENLSPYLRFETSTAFNQAFDLVFSLTELRSQGLSMIACLTPG